MTQEQLESSRMFPLGLTGIVGYMSLSLVLLGMGILMMGASKGCAEAKSPETLTPASQSISVYALSRGKGVPDQAREVFLKAQELLKAAQKRGDVLRMVEQRIGLEGETKVCAEFSSGESAQTMIDQIQQLGRGVELFNAKVEPCPP